MSKIKLINLEENFYEKRLNQLNFYINYLNKHLFLSNSKEFKKFILETLFDKNFFDSLEALESDFPLSLSLTTENLKNKIFNAFSSLINGKETYRLINKDEIKLKKLDLFYKNLNEKYKEIFKNFSKVIKHFKINESNFFKLSNSYFYLKDTLEDVEFAYRDFSNFSKLADDIASNNGNQFLSKGLEIEYKFEVLKFFKFQNFLSLIEGLNDALNRYSNFLETYETVQKAYIHAKNANVNNNILGFHKESAHIDNIKSLFERTLNDEIDKFVELNSNTFYEIVNQFKIFLYKVKKQVILSLNY